jgi:hypothetical protein
MKPATPERVYLQQVYPSQICFLDEVLYWVTFQRLPLHFVDLDGNDVRSVVMPGYRVDFDSTDHTLEDGECERVGLPRDPRNSFTWASRITLLDDLERLAALAQEWNVMSRAHNMSSAHYLSRLKRVVARTRLLRDAGVIGVTPNEIAQLHKKLERWKPKYKKVIELPAARVYVALKEGKLGASGILLSDVDAETALEALARQGRNLSNFRDVEISREFWSEQEIFWELSAARNDHEHYCQIHCDTEKVLSLFPPESLISGAPVIGTRFGSFFVLEGPATGGRPTTRPAIQRTRRPGRPPQYPWGEVHLELTSLIASGKLPNKKEAGIEHIRNWFTSQNLSPPSRAAIGEKLTPYYDRFVRNGRQKISSPASDGAA